MNEWTREVTRRVFMTLNAAASLGTAGVTLPTLAEAAAATISDVDKRNIDTVLGLSAVFKLRDASKLEPFFHENVIFRASAERVGAPPTIGRDKVIAGLAGFFKTT